jgi:hypothetical protein
MIPGQMAASGIARMVIPDVLFGYYISGINHDLSFYLSP